MRASSKRTLSILAAVLLLIGAVFVYSSLISPAYSQIKFLRSEVATRLNIINENQVYIAQVRNLLNEYQNAAQLQNTISLVLPDEQNLAQVLNQISGLMSISGLSPDRVSVSQLSTRPSLGSSIVKSIGTSRFEVGASGNYSALKSFLQKAESNISILDIAGVKVGQSAKGINTGLFSYTFTIDTYYQTQ